MAMDFFEHQDAARRKTGRMVVLFSVAVLVIMVLIYLVVAIAVLGFGAKAGVEDGGALLFNPVLMLGVAAGTIAIIGLSSMYKTAQLRAGGSVVAESLGGRLLHRYTSDPLEQRVLNVVEEIAIASGTACPPVYLLEHEAGINAFAAGYNPGNAVIGITRGCAEQLSRDELQGVVAHEFSHILNGDMRLNIRLIGVLHGILVIGIIGYFAMRTAALSGGGRRSSKESGGAMMAILLIGVGLIIIGFAGTFFGNLIKAAVSRQREFLADASAVQFTRNPDGIGGALRRIGGLSAGASIANPNAPQASHMFFGQAVSLSAMLATHPPLPTRIKRIDPSWDGTFLKARTDVKPSKRRGDKTGKRETLTEQRRREFEKLRQRGSASSAMESIGNPSREHVVHAAILMAMLAGELESTAREPYGARAVIYALLIDTDTTIADKQFAHLRGAVHAEVYRLSQQMLQQVRTLDPQARLPLMDLALPALREMTGQQYSAFRFDVDALIAADRRIDLQEWIIRRIVVHHLDQHFGRAARSAPTRRKLKDLAQPCAVLLSVLARVGSSDVVAAKTAFARAAKEVDLAADVMLGSEACTLSALDEALAALDGALPLVKRQVIRACTECVLADEEVTPHETELLRAVCDSLGCPMPPLISS